MFDSLPLVVLILIFIIAAIIVWIAGIHLSNAADILSSRWELGEALGGLILLAIVTNLPEIAITTSGAIHHEMSLAVGNILGGIAIQTVVLVMLDIFGLGKKAALTYRAASLTLVLEGVLVIAALAIAIMSTQFPASLIFARVTPGGLLIVILWVIGLWLIGKSRRDLPWQERGTAPAGQHKPRGHSQHKKDQKAKDKKISTKKTLLIFIVGAVATLVCGVVLESAGSTIARNIGMSGALFGAIVLAAATSLPELSTGLASVKLDDYQLAVSDIFGGNAFLPVLFLLATLLSGQAVLPHAQKADIYLTALGLLLTTIYITGLIFRPHRQIARMGIDSFIVLLLYILGILGLIAITRG